MPETPLPTALLTGATGFLGRRLAASFPSGYRVVRASRTASGPDSERLDLESEASIREAFSKVRPAVVIHAGAVAGPDDCERDPALAARVNRDATRTVAALCGETGARLVHFSTDLVFDGEKGWYGEDDATNPISVYGRTKLEAEEAALSRAPGAVVLRVASLYGRPMGGKGCFVDELRAALSRGLPAGAFVDQWRTATAADALGDLIGRILADPDLDGVFHWGGAERATRFETAVALCRAFGWDPGLVRPTRMGDKKTPARRPRDSSLDSSRLAAALGVAPTTLADGFAALKAAG